MAEPRERSGAEAVVEALVRAGVEVVFALPGQQLDELFNAFYHARDKIRLIHPRHEQATAYMANGYALATGKLGVAVVVPGPGLLNASAALSTGWAANAPVLCVTGQIPSRFIGKGTGQLHEIPNQLRSVEGFTKYQGSIMNPAEAPGVMARAISEATSGRNRPVVVEIPPDILQARGPVDFGNFNPAPHEPALDAAEVERAAALIAKAKYPVICAGSGAIGASAVLTKLAEKLGAPVVMSQYGIGAIGYRSPYAHTLISGMELWAKADLAIAVGTRFSTQTAWGRDDDLKLIRIDPDPVQSLAAWKPDVHLLTTAEVALPALLAAANGKSDWSLSELQAAKHAAEARMAKEVAASDVYTRALRAGLPDLIGDLTSLPGVEDVALTTNGVLLAQHAAELRAAGLRRVTVSLDSLDPAVFAQMAGGFGSVDDVLAGIAAAQRAGLSPIKLNAVVQRGVNDHQVLDLVEHFRGTGVVVRFIEYMDVGNRNEWNRERVVPSQQLLERIGSRWPLSALDPAYAGEVARRYGFDDDGGEVGFISSVTQPFCGDCSRARLSSDGKFYTCLFAGEGTDLRAPMRGGASDEELLGLIRAVWERRSDRYSELRDNLRARGVQHVEMNYVGG